MGENILQLNQDKSEVLVIGTRSCQHIYIY